MKLQLHIDLHIHNYPEGHSDFQESLNAILSKQDQILAKGEQIMLDLTALEAQVQQNTDLEQGSITLLTGLAAQFEAAKGDPAKVQALADKLKASADSLAAALVANTPAEA